MDNAKIHCGEMVKEFIEEAGAKLIYLSPYSPDFSSREKFRSKVKSILIELKTRNYLDLIGAITDAMLQVFKKDVHN
jgi:transposase